MLMLLAEKWTPHSAGIAYLQGGRPVLTVADKNQVWVPRSLRFVQGAGACAMQE